MLGKKEKKNLTVFAATFESTQDALREYKTVHFDGIFFNKYTPIYVAKTLKNQDNTDF